MDVSDLTISYFEDGQEVVKELNKEVLSKGAWATVIYRYIEGIDVKMTMVMRSTQ